MVKQNVGHGKQDSSGIKIQFLPTRRSFWKINIDDSSIMLCAVHKVTLSCEFNSFETSICP